MFIVVEHIILSILRNENRLQDCDSGENYSSDKKHKCCIYPRTSFPRARCDYHHHRVRQDWWRMPWDNNLCHTSLVPIPKHSLTYPLSHKGHPQWGCNFRQALVLRFPLLRNYLYLNQTHFPKDISDRQFLLPLFPIRLPLVTAPQPKHNNSVLHPSLRRQQDSYPLKVLHRLTLPDHMLAEKRKRLPQRIGSIGYCHFSLIDPEGIQVYGV